MQQLLRSSAVVVLASTAVLAVVPAFDAGAAPGLRLASLADVRDLGSKSGAKGLGSSTRGDKACVEMNISCNSTVTGVLDTTDCQLGDDSRIDFWSFQGTAGMSATVNMSSDEFDTYLFLVSPLPDLVTFGRDDDGGAGTDSIIESSLDETGEWAIGANGFDASNLGPYTLRLDCSSGTPMAPAAPTGLTAETLSSTEIGLGWNDNSNNEREFRIEYRSPGGAGFEYLGSVGSYSTGIDAIGLDPETTYDFRIRASNKVGSSSYSNTATATTFGGPGTCVPSETNLCLLDGRFKVEVDWRNFEGVTGPGMVVPFGSADSGLFYFFDADNWEMLVKMVDACNSPFDSFWVFAAATTNVEYTLRVTDTDTGVVKPYFNPLGTAAAAITDTSAFATCP
jgi:Fibronectin type III domain